MSKNHSEIYIAKLCSEIFFSLTCYSNPYDSKTTQQKEVCDLLVILGNNILIFSVKHCTILENQDLSPDSTRRYYRKAIEKSIEQLEGAENRIRDDSTGLQDRDRGAIDLPVEPKIYKIALAFGATSSLEQLYKTKSFFYSSEKTRPEEFPTTVNQKYPAGSHVFTEASFSDLLEIFDTAADFISYLEYKEKILDKKNYFYKDERTMAALYYFGNDIIETKPSSTNYMYLNNIVVGHSSYHQQDIIHFEGMSSVQPHSITLLDDKLIPALYSKLSTIRESNKSSYLWDNILKYQLGKHNFFKDEPSTDMETLKKVSLFILNANRETRQWFSEQLIYMSKYLNDKSASDTHDMGYTTNENGDDKIISFMLLVRIPTGYLGCCCK